MRAGSEAAPPGSRGLLLRMLGIGMSLTILGIAAVARYLGFWSWPAALVLGVILSPTDPVFIAAIFAFDAVPARLRWLLNVESGSSLAA